MQALRISGVWVKQAFDFKCPSLTVSRDRLFMTIDSYDDFSGCHDELLYSPSTTSINVTNSGSVLAVSVRDVVRQ